MSEDRFKILDKAKKLKELADRGVDGEQSNAKVMFAAYKKKHNITDEELENYHYKYAKYVNMSDDEFLNELMKESIEMGLSFIFSRFGSDELKKKINKETLDFFDKHGKVIVERVNKMQKK